MVSWGFVSAVVVFAVGLGAAWFVGSALIARRRGVAADAVLHATIPIPWGAAAPAAALFLDAASFRCSAPPLAALGIGVGAIAAARRVSRLAGAGREAREHRMLLVALAIALPLALLPSWLPPSGDEPHYLIVAGSIVDDGDLDVGADYASRAYAPFHPQVLSPHYKEGLRDGSRYSMHGAGLPVLIVPAYVIGRALGPWAMVALPRGMLVLAYGLFAWLLYGLIREMGGERAASGGTAAAVLFAPLLFSPTFIFPEVPAMVLALVAYRGLRNSEGVGGLVLASAAVALLPWLGVKYLPLAVTLALVGCLRAAPAPRRSRISAGLGGVALGVATHGLYTWTLYGSLSPAAVYLGSEGSGAPALGGDWAAYLAQWPDAAATLMGYFIDQKEGLLAYGPHFLLAVVGLPWLWRRHRTDVVALALLAAVYLAPYALSQQLGGQGPPVRPLMAILWTIAPALGVALAVDSGRQRWYASLRGALLALSGCLTVAYASQPHLLPHDYPVAASRLVRAYSASGSAWWRAFPQWVNVEDPNWGVTAVWTLGVVAVAVVLWRFGNARAALALPGDHEVVNRGSGRRDGERIAFVSAAVAATLIIGFVLVHHAVVVATDLHRPTTLDAGPVAWVGIELPERAWAEAGGVWTSPGRGVDFILVVDQPIDTVDIELRVLVEGHVGAWLGTAELVGVASPMASLVARLDPGDGWPARGGYAYWCRLIATAGGSPAVLMGTADERHLGVFFGVRGWERRD